MAETRPARLPAPQRARRSHAERTAETRARVIEAVFESIAEVGFARTTATEITRRAGVTWGAVQHHFGGKDALLVAVVEDSFERFAARLEGIPVEGVPLEQRVALFIDRAWEHFASREYRSTFEILLNYLGREDVRHDVPTWQGSMFRAWDGIWMRLFHDAGIPRQRHRVVEHYVISTLSGLASTLVLEGAAATMRREELDMLKGVLLSELEG
ncbi:MAG: TetR/AcrR family transcriptional regulator [Myxococcota bacterium]